MKNCNKSVGRFAFNGTLHKGHIHILERVRPECDILVPYPKECNKCNDLESCWGGCVYANKFGGYCKEYKISLEIMKELKLRRDKDVKTSTI